MLFEDAWFLGRDLRAGRARAFSASHAFLDVSRISSSFRPTMDKRYHLAQAELLTGGRIGFMETNMRKIIIGLTILLSGEVASAQDYSTSQYCSSWCLEFRSSSQDCSYNTIQQWAPVRVAEHMTDARIICDHPI